MPSSPSSALAVIDSDALIERFPGLDADAMEAYQANLTGTDANLGVLDLDRIVVPSGGGRSWEVPGLDGPESVQALTGVVLATIPRRSYWEVPMEESGGAPPDCASDDGEIGRGLYGVGSDIHPTGKCATCPMAQWTPKDNGTGNYMPCKEQRLVIFQREGEILPVVIQAAPTSIAAFKVFNRRLTNRAIPFYRAIVEISLERRDKPIAHSVMEPRLVGVVSPEAGEEFKRMGQQIKDSWARQTAGPAASDA